MIIFNNTNLPMKKILDENVINTRIFNIEIHNKAILDIDLLAEMNTILEAFLLQEDRCIICINHLKDAFLNNEEYEYGNITEKVFKSLLTQYIQAGHEIVLYISKGDTLISNMMELEEIDGIDIISDQIKLMEHLKTHVL